MKFKELNWKPYNDCIWEATPYGFNWGYYITSLGEDQFELELINVYGDSDSSLATTHKTSIDAQNKAKEHYLDILKHHLYTHESSFEK